MGMAFRLLRADEIEVRVQSVKNGKVTMLLYIDSRCVTNFLDEAVGCMNWQTEFYSVNGQIMGKLGIWDYDKKMWIWKSDTGSESNIQAEKGLISDIYKRLLSRWSVTELYTAPHIQLDDDGYGNSGYRVSEIAYEGRKIIHLVIINKFGKEAFRWDINGNNTNYDNLPTTTTTKQLSKEDIIQDVRNKANEIYSTIAGCQRDEFKNCVNYYIKKIENGKWQGGLDINKVWDKWKNSSYRKAS